MAWKNIFDRKIVLGNSSYGQSFKVTPEADESESEWVGSIDIFRNHSRLVRLLVKQFPSNNWYPGSTTTPAVYVYQKLFKWDSSVQNYLKQSQVPLTLPEFKALQENMQKLDQIIDKAVTLSLTTEEVENHNYRKTTKIRAYF